MKKSNNYSAWKVSETDFDDIASDVEKLRFFSRYAILAPSGHNTQPWIFTFNKDHLLITENPARELPHSGKLAAEPYVSLGSCTETLVLAGKSFGYKIKISKTLKPSVIIEARIAGRETPDITLAQSIVRRTSNRKPYSKIKIDKNILNKICTTTNTTIIEKIIEKDDEIAYIAQETAQATINIMSEPAFRLELSKWVRNNLTKQYDGMPAFVQGMPLPPSLVAKHVIKNIDISKSQAKNDAARVKNSAALIILSSKQQNMDNFFDLGREYARICIIAEQNGLATSGVGAAAIDGESKVRIKEFFGIPGTPSALIRIGKPTKEVHHAPRLPLEMVTAN